jgi:hypothetical protein
MNLTTVTSEGNLIPAEILDAIAAGEAAGQKPADFGLDPARRLTDEIAAVWTEVRDYWRAFGHRLRRPGAGESATTITREHWVVPMLRALGYAQLTYQPQAAVANNRTYAISHRAGTGEDAPPVHIVGFPAQPGQGTLDERPASGRPRLSPHGLVQEYLNATDEHLWGITTNGAQLRLLRDSSRTSRPTYLEFDLQGMMDGEQFAQFALFYRALHRTRLPAPGQDPATCLLEQYHQQALAAGGRVREKLREGVQRALETLGGGLLSHSRNEALRAAWSAGRLTSAEYYRQLLRLVYRLLFLMVAEERQLIGAEADQAIYRDYYSLARLRRLAETPASGLERYDDLWLGLLALFRALQDDTGAAPLHVAALDGDLFGAGALPDLMATHLDNRSLLGAIYALSVYRDEAGKGQRRVNYSALDVEELGSVYESLLDLRPVIEAGADGLHFRFAQGTDRKTTGSYYTRPELVRELIKSALEPVLADRLRAAGEDKDAAERAILGMTVCDPACGSGHFLLAAARRLGRELATVRTGEAQPGPEPFRRAVRDVIGHCIYGVDANPLAVDLCKLALWTEGYNKGMPLNFLDHHIKCGNSLVGATRALVEGGIPDGAYDPVTGDDKPTASALKKRNKQERESYLKAGVFQQSLPFGASTPARDPQAVLVAGARALEAAPDSSVAAYHAKADAYTRWRLDAHDQQTLYNLWTAAFFVPLTRDNAHIPTTKTVIEFSRRPSAADGQMIGTVNSLAQKLGFFHWDLEFPYVFQQGGFDMVLGNPPWEMIELKPEEFFLGLARTGGGAGV